MEGLRHLNLKRTGETEIPKGLSIAMLLATLGVII
jgi:hypothetical protein